MGDMREYVLYPRQRGSDFSVLKLIKNVIYTTYCDYGMSPEEIQNQKNAWSRIRTCEPLRDQALNLTPLTWLGDPRA